MSLIKHKDCPRCGEARVNEFSQLHPGKRQKGHQVWLLHRDTLMTRCGDGGRPEKIHAGS